MIPLSRQNLIIKAAQRHTRIRPRIEMRPRINTASNTLTASHTPVLLECRRAHDTRRIGPLRLVDIVGRAVGVHGSLVRLAATGVVGAVAVDDVVFDQRVACPAVDG